MASGDTLAKFLPQSVEPLAANTAAFDTRNQHPVWDFDAATNEFIVFTEIMPRNYDGGGVILYIHYAMSSAEADTIDLDGAFERIGDQQQDLDSDGFAAVQSVDNVTVPGNAGDVDIVSIAFTDGAEIDSIAVGELYRLKITRDADNDDAAGDLEYRGAELVEA